MTTHKFTGYERDAESNLDNAQARYNSSSLGRFMSPDPIGNFVADATNPQTWNMYAYVNNDPTGLIDPTGLCGGADYGWWPSDTAVYVVGDGSCFDPSLFGWAFGGLSFPILHGGSGRGGGGSLGLLSRITGKVCSAIPQGQVLSTGGALGALGAVGGSANLVTNYNTGQTTLSFSGSVGGGWNGAASGSVSAGYIFSRLAILELRLFRAVL